MAEALPQSFPEISGSDNTVLRRVVLENSPRVFELAHMDFNHFLLTGLRAEEFETLEAVRQTVANAETRSVEEWPGIELGIWTPDVMVGCIGFAKRSENTAEIWGWVGKDYARHGHISSAVKTLVPYLYANGFPVVIARAKTDNKKSKRALYHLGFRHFGWQGDYLLYQAPAEFK
jgi:RimJ/RimL family protein N-acetyltransferase